jgi:hypothetical protein
MSNLDCHGLELKMESVEADIIPASTLPTIVVNSSPPSDAKANPASDQNPDSEFELIKSSSPKFDLGAEK